MKTIGFALVFLSILISCSKEISINSTEIIGSWSNEDLMEDPELISEQLYHFKSDNKVIVERNVLVVQTNEILGYRYRAIGQYSIKGESLTIDYVEIYKHDDRIGSYSDLSDLELSDEVRQDKMRISFEDSFNQLNFHYEPCGPSKNCILHQKFERKD